MTDSETTLTSPANVRGEESAFFIKVSGDSSGTWEVEIAGPNGELSFGTDDSPGKAIRAARTDYQDAFCDKRRDPKLTEACVAVMKRFQR